MHFNFAKTWQTLNSKRLSKPVDVHLAQFSALREYGISFKVFKSSKLSKLAEKANLVPILVPKNRILKNLDNKSGPDNSATLLYL